MRSGRPRSRRGGPRPAHRDRRGGQAAVEVALAVVVSTLFVVCSMKIWIWLTRAIVREQRCYQQTREIAGRNANPGLGNRNPYTDEGGMTPYGNPYWSTAPRLNVFNEPEVGITTDPCG